MWQHSCTRHASFRCAQPPHAAAVAQRSARSTPLAQTSDTSTNSLLIHSTFNLWNVRTSVTRQPLTEGATRERGHVAFFLAVAIQGGGGGAVEKAAEVRCQAGNQIRTSEWGLHKVRRAAARREATRASRAPRHADGFQGPFGASLGPRLQRRWPVEGPVVVAGLARPPTAAAAPHPGNPLPCFAFPSTPMQPR